jgi:hypothetical protein
MIHAKFRMPAASTDAGDEVARGGGPFRSAWRLAALIAAASLLYVGGYAIARKVTASPDGQNLSAYDISRFGVRPLIWLFHPAFRLDARLTGRITIFSVGRVFDGYGVDLGELRGWVGPLMNDGSEEGTMP